MKADNSTSLFSSCEIGCNGNCDGCAASPGSSAAAQAAVDWAHLIADSKPALSDFWRAATISDIYRRSTGIEPDVIVRPPHADFSGPWWMPDIKILDFFCGDPCSQKYPKIVALGDSVGPFGGVANVYATKAQAQQVADNLSAGEMTDAADTAEASVKADIAANPPKCTSKLCTCAFKVPPANPKFGVDSSSSGVGFSVYVDVSMTVSGTCEMIPLPNINLN